ncbi:uncharacterized protein RCH25_036122 [Pelodytes ibericus]
MELRNTTWLFYPSQGGNTYADIEEIIASQNVISRVVHSYFGILVPLGLLAGIVSVIIITCNKIRHHLDFYLLNLAIADITIVLYSFTAITRPDYMEITNLSCGVIAALFNLSYFYSQYILLLVLFLLVYLSRPNTSSWVIRVTECRTMCMCFTLLFSLVMSLVAVSLLGTYKHLNTMTHCQLDPLNALPEYDLVKFSVGFCIPSLLVLLLLALLVVWPRAEDSEVKKRLKDHVAVLLNISVVFACRLFYNIMLLRRTGLKLQEVYLYPREELVMNVAELVLLSGSCISLMSTLTLHGPCRLGVWKAFQFIKRKCGGMQASSNVEMNDN